MHLPKIKLAFKKGFKASQIKTVLQMKQVPEFEVTRLMKQAKLENSKFKKEAKGKKAELFQVDGVPKKYLDEYNLQTTELGEEVNYYL